MLIKDFHIGVTNYEAYVYIEFFKVTKMMYIGWHLGHKEDSYDSSCECPEYLQAVFDTPDSQRIKIIFKKGNPFSMASLEYKLHVKRLLKRGNKDMYYNTSVGGGRYLQRYNQKELLLYGKNMVDNKEWPIEDFTYQQIKSWGAFKQIRDVTLTGSRQDDKKMLSDVNSAKSKLSHTANGGKGWLAFAVENGLGIDKHMGIGGNHQLDQFEQSKFKNQGFLSVMKIDKNWWDKLTEVNQRFFMASLNEQVEVTVRPMKPKEVTNIVKDMIELDWKTKDENGVPKTITNYDDIAELIKLMQKFRKSEIDDMMEDARFLAYDVGVGKDENITHINFSKFSVDTIKNDEGHYVEINEEMKEKLINEGKEKKIIRKPYSNLVKETTERSDKTGNTKCVVSATSRFGNAISMDVYTNTYEDEDKEYADKLHIDVRYHSKHSTQQNTFEEGGKLSRLKIHAKMYFDAINTQYNKNITFSFKPLEYNNKTWIPN